MSGAVVTQLAGLESKYRPYPEYKDSGVEWLDCLPMDWGKTTLKMLIDVRDGTHDTPSYVEVSEDSFPIVTSKDVTGGKIDLTNCKHISKEDYEAIIKRSAVSEGDILMPMIGTVGFPILVTGHSNFAIKNLALFKTSERSELISTVFLLYFLNSNECSLQFSLESRGGVQNFVSLGTLRNLGLPLVPFKEQQKIVNFLDHETARIDRLIAQQQRLIELLKEKRQAVISHAVTKGLNPDAPMKESGIEWLGQVPEHWAVMRLKHLIKSLESGCSVNAADVPAKEDELGVLKTSCVYTRRFRASENKTVVMEDFSRVKCPVRKGAIIISRMNTPELVGASALVDTDASNLFLPDRLWQTIFNDQFEVNPEFLAHFMTVEGFRNQISLSAEGASSSMQNIAKEDYLAINALLPLLEEQIEIVDYIKESEARFLRLEAQAMNAIELMKERRIALISAAVTGKIDLRGWEPPVEEVAA